MLPPQNIIITFQSTPSIPANRYHCLVYKHQASRKPRSTAIALDAERFRRHTRLNARSRRNIWSTDSRRHHWGLIYVEDLR